MIIPGAVARENGSCPRRWGRFLCEILVSALVREIVDARGDLTFNEPRTERLKGLPGQWAVHPVRWQRGT